MIPMIAAGHVAWFVNITRSFITGVRRPIRDVIRPSHEAELENCSDKDQAVLS